MLTRLRLTNFKSFADATLELGNFAVIVGANASGKSNIRDAFRFLHGIGRGYTIPEIIGGKWSGGQAEWAPLRGSASELIRFGANRFELQVRLNVNRQSFYYEIGIRADERARSGFRIDREELRVGYRTIFTSHPGGGDPVDAQDDEAHLLLRLEKTGDQKRYGLKLSVRPDQPALTQIEDYQRVVKSHKDIVRTAVQALSDIRFLDLVPEMMRRPSFPGQSSLGDNGENLPTVLQDICLDPRKKRVLSEWMKELTPMDVVDFEFPREVSGLIQLAFREANGNFVSAYSASDGTLRFLAMLAALLGRTSAVTYFFEEIDNGIHPSRLRLLLDLLERQTEKGTVQVVTTTHSPDLLAMVNEQTFQSTSVVYRNAHAPQASIKAITSIPRAVELRKSQGLGRLHASGWLEDALAFEADEEASAA